MQSGMTAMNGVEDVLRLPAVLDLAAAEVFLGSVHQHLQTRPALCLDASGVETLTLPCVQIILAAVATQRVSIVGPSDAFESAFRDLALDWKTDAEGREAPESPVRPAPEPASKTAQQSVAQEIVAQGTVAKETVVQESAIPGIVPELARTAVPDLLPSLELLPAQALVQAPQQQLAQEFMQAEAPAVIPDAPASMEEEPIEQEPSQSDQTDGNSMAKRILTIDDSKTMRDMLMLTLEEAGFEVLQAVDGQHGLDVLGQERVDVVITDINMPKLDGYGVIRKLRSNPVHKTTPILVLTTESDAEKKVIAREAGATGWMVKPFDPDRLIATIRKVAP
jgi:CheY-like chemotaxis protein